MTTLRLILGDQLSHTISSLEGLDIQNDIVLMCELIEEATYVKHHKKKIALFFSAMRHFAEELQHKNINVLYKKLNDIDNQGSFEKQVSMVINHYKITNVIVTEPGEHRILSQFQNWSKTLGINVDIRDDNRFICSINHFKSWAKNRKTLRLEQFYRQQRQSNNILMQGNMPVGNEWNFDKENRKKAPECINIIPALTFQPDKITQEVIDLVNYNFSDHLGDLEPFNFAINRTQALQQLNHFIQHRLAQFGDYQDAMLHDEPDMFHSLLSPYLNIGLLNPRECISAAEQAYLADKAPINSVEAFIRQILGWREFVRGIYWLLMPDYESNNFFNANNQLPDFFWTGNTEMNCIKQSIKATFKHANAHHIQRLMVLGNFLLLTEASPNAVNEWYMIVYADAIQWVELPNVTGMALFADGGVFASKPYIASGAYINKMSNYCTHCRFNVKQKTGDDACPFNYLYWNFLIKNRSLLSCNNRMSLIYKVLDRFSQDIKSSMSQKAQQYLENL